MTHRSPRHPSASQRQQPPAFLTGAKDEERHHLIRRFRRGEFEGRRGPTEPQASHVAKASHALQPIHQALTRFRAGAFRLVSDERSDRVGGQPLPPVQGAQLDEEG